MSVGLCIIGVILKRKKKQQQHGPSLDLVHDVLEILDYLCTLALSTWGFTHVQRLHL